LLKTYALELPGPLASATARIATQVATGGSLTQIASPSIANLVQKVIGSMFMTKLKTIALCVLIFSAGAFGLTLAAAQTPRGRRATPDQRERPVSAKSKAQPPLTIMKEYVVEPPDLVTVEVLDALPGRPISGERLVRPDGRISLGFYGDLYVAGLTLPELKEKIVNHLKPFLQDETLGLIVLDEETGEPVLDPKTGENQRIDPKNSNRVFVDVTAYNSKNYYLEGEFAYPGKLPVTGTERILDAISYAGGLTSEADHERVYLYRESAKGEPPQTLKIDIDQIMLGDDLSTNYQLLPGDKLVVRRRERAPRDQEKAPARPTAPRPKPGGDSNYFVDTRPTEAALKQSAGASDTPAVQRLERRMSEIERKLDQILEALRGPRG
jgi:polysaccharide export outer membrane protein